MCDCSAFLLDPISTFLDSDVKRLSVTSEIISSDTANALNWHYNIYETTGLITHLAENHILHATLQELRCSSRGIINLDVHA